MKTLTLFLNGTLGIISTFVFFISIFDITIPRLWAGWSLFGMGLFWCSFIQILKSED